MRILAFILGMLAATIAVAVWSVLSGASFGTTVLRMIMTLLVAQGLYVFAVVLMSRGAGKPRPADPADPAPGAEKARLGYASKENPGSPG